MANVGNAFKQLGDAFGKLGKVMGKTFDKAARADILKDDAIAFTKEMSNPGKRNWFIDTLSWGTWGVRKPAEYVVRGASQVVNGVAIAYGKAPIVTSAVAAGAAGLGVVGVVNDRRGRHEAMERQAEYEQQAMELQAQQAMLQAQAQPRFKNSTTEADYRLLEERMRGGDQAPSAHGQSVLDARAAAQAANAPSANG